GVRYGLAARMSETDSGPSALRLKRQPVAPLLSEIVAQPCFGLGRVQPFDDLTGRRGKTATEFHGVRRPSSGRKGLSAWTLWCSNYSNFTVAVLRGLDRARA